MRSAQFRVLASLLFLAAVLAPASCGGPSSQASTSNPTELPCCSDSPTAIQVVDAAGRTVRLDKVPQRIVVVGRAPYMTVHLLYMFPVAWDRLVGVEVKAKAASDFLPLIDPAFNSKAALMTPGPEQIAALQPDLVLLKGTTADQLSTALAQVKIPSVYLGLETPDLLFHDIANLGTLLGDEARAREITAFFQSRLDGFRQVVSGLAEADKPRVLLMMYIDRGGQAAVQVPARSWMQTIEVETAGGRPVWFDAAAVTDGWTVVNLEQVAAWDPDKVFVVVWNLPDVQGVIDSLKADPQWSALRAVQDGELYAFPTDMYGWDSADPRWILGMDWLATHIYPDRFQGIDMQEEVYQFFGQMYGMERAAVDAKVMPAVLMDVH